MTSHFNTIAPRLLNVGLRGFSLGSRFILLIFLGRFLEPSEVGIYGLFMATVIFSWQLLGGEVHNHGNRELLKVGHERWSFIIQHMSIAMLLLYLIIGPSLALIFVFDLLPVSLALWFFPIVICDHLSQEMYRTLNVLGSPIKAGIVLLVRSGSWVWFAIFHMWLFPEARELAYVLAWWLLGGFLSIFIGGVMLYRAISLWQLSSIQWNWIVQAFKVGFLFLISAVAIRALTTIDRYAMEFINGDTLVGAYVFFIGLAMSPIMILEPAILSFLQPQLMSAHYNGDKPLYKRVFREMSWSLIGLTVLLTMVVGFLAPWIIDWTGQEIYRENLPLMWLLLATPIVYAAGLPPQSGLYTKGRDRFIILTNCLPLPVFFLLTALCSSALPVEAPAIGLIGAMLTATIIRTTGYLKD